MMKNHFEKFLLFDFILFGLVMILYHYSGINDNFFKNLFKITQEQHLNLTDQGTIDTLKFWYLTSLLPQSSCLRALSLYSVTFLLGRLLPSQLWLRMLILLLCAVVSVIVFEPLISLSPYSILLLGVNLLLFLHWHQTYQSSSLRLSYLCVGIMILNQGMISLGLIFSLYILYLVATKTLKKRIKGLLDPIGLILLMMVLVLWHQDIRSYANPYLAPFFPALGLLLSFKIDRIWHHRWIQKYRQWISSGLALSLPTGALIALYHSQGLPESFQPLLNNLSTSPYWIWLSLSTFGVFRCFKFRRSFWPEVTTAFQMIPLMMSGVHVIHDNHHLSFLQPFTQNILNQMTTVDPLKKPLLNVRLPRHLKQMIPVFDRRNASESEIILKDFYAKD